MSKKRKTYSATFKAKVALAAQRQDKTISQLAASQKRLHSKVHPIVISRWKAQLLDNAEQVFQDKRTKKKSDDRTHDELYQEIGRLKVERSQETGEKESRSNSLLLSPYSCLLTPVSLLLYPYRPLSLRVSDVWITSDCIPI